MDWRDINNDYKSKCGAKNTCKNYISLWWKEAVACLILAPISEMVLAWEELPWADQISQE